MAYESMTYEFILNRELERVREKYPNLDTREGSIIFDALAPCALELAIAYTNLDNVLKESFVDTATREYIYKKCYEIGIDTNTFEAKAGTHKGVFNVEIEIGSRWNCDLYNYVVDSFIGMEDTNYTYQLECETTGSAPNIITGDLTPLSYNPNGLTYAELTECLIDGEDEVTDEVIRETYYSHVQRGAKDGNVAMYEEQCEIYPGIGNYKVFPLWNGPNTVKTSILSASNDVASQTLIDEFQEHLDPNSEGLGNGVAPIGAIVTVSTATPVTLNIEATLTLKEGYSDTSVIDTSLRNYLSQMAYKSTKVAYMNIGAVIINTNGVESIADGTLLINGQVDGIELGEEEIPVLGTTNWTVV